MVIASIMEPLIGTTRPCKAKSKSSHLPDKELYGRRYVSADGISASEARGGEASSSVGWLMGHGQRQLPPVAGEWTKLTTLQALHVRIDVCPCSFGRFGQLGQLGQDRNSMRYLKVWKGKCRNCLVDQCLATTTTSFTYSLATLGID